MGPQRLVFKWGAWGSFLFFYAYGTALNISLKRDGTDQIIKLELIDTIIVFLAIYCVMSLGRLDVFTGHWSQGVHAQLFCMYLFNLNQVYLWQQRRSRHVHKPIWSWLSGDK